MNTLHCKFWNNHSILIFLNDEESITFMGKQRSFCLITIFKGCNAQIRIEFKPTTGLLRYQISMITFRKNESFT